jgi:hypothetical protein
MSGPTNFAIGPYSLVLPAHAHVAGSNEGKPAKIVLGRFQLSAHLDKRGLDGLAAVITDQTQRTVATSAIIVNGVPGVTFGDYGPPRTWIDWWFRKGDLTLCLRLQSVQFPVTLPADDEVAEHNAIITSLRHKTAD